MPPFVDRTLAATIRQVSASFPALLLTGPRQVGKTTLLQACAEPGRGYATLDDLDQRDLAQRDPALFLQRYPPPVIIDEVQYAPRLFSGIKMAVDRERKAGLFWLTGSQKFHLMQGIGESLAGRVAILDLLGLSQAELAGYAGRSRPFLPTAQWLASARERAGPPQALMDLYRAIWRGGFPQAALDPGAPRDIFYRSYLQTYIQRDVRQLARVGDELAFQRCVRAAAARTGQLVNYADLARDVDVDQKTLKSWMIYRDRDMKEIGLLIEQDDTLYPIEIKKTATPSRGAANNFGVLDRLGHNIGEGAVLCLRETDLPLADAVSAIPVRYL